jgi:hypothetical protein
MDNGERRTDMVRRAVILIILLAGMARPAAAQGITPDTGLWGLTVSAGMAAPTEDLFTSGLDVGVSLERYFTPRVSIRGQISGAFWDFKDFDEDSASPLAVTGNLVYNWEANALHPYVTAGLGVYTFRLTEANVDESDTNFGINLGGGLEYFLSDRDAVLGAVTMHAVSGNAEGTFGDYGTSYWTIVTGYKRYF